MQFSSSGAVEKFIGLDDNRYLTGDCTLWLVELEHYR
jgi:hypothetical protein